MSDDDYVVPPMTQGQRKTRQRLKELFYENEEFKREFEEIRAMPNKTKQNKRMWKLAYKYRLVYEIGSPLADILLGNDPGLNTQRGHELDVCEILDEEDHYLNQYFPVDYLNPPSHLPRERSIIMAYPIHIGISLNATKRDVLDFINKRWEYIRYMLDQYTTRDKPLIIRKRLKSERDELIWQNRGLPAKEIAELVNAKFPEEGLTYADINSILYYLKRRRLSSLA